MPSKQHRALQILCLSFLGFLLPISLRAETCRGPDLSDPDEMFDSIGRENQCFEEIHSSSAIRGPSGFLHFGPGWLNSGTGGALEAGRAAVVTTNGSLLVAGRNGDNANDFLVYKYQPDGTYDTSFSTNGMGNYGLNSDDWAHALVLQTDGNAVVVGRSDPGGAGEFDFTLIRLITNGAYDTTFNTNGKKFIDFSTTTDIPRGAVLQTNGKIVAAGYTKNSNLYDFAFVRIETDGSLDTSFSTDGKHSVSVVGSDDGAMSVAIDSNGAVVGVGPAYDGTRWVPGFVKLLQDGSMDTSFNSTGKLTRSIPVASSVDNQALYGVQIDAANRIVAGGGADNSVIRESRNVQWDTVLARFQTDGNFDTAFRTTGYYYNDLTGVAVLDGINGIALATDGLTVYAAGFYNNNTNNDFLALRFKSDGNLDSSFSTKGYIQKALYSAEDTAQAIAMKGDGVIYAVGRTNDGGSYDVAVLRLDSGGTVARSATMAGSFGTGGFKTYDFNATTDSATGITQDAAGRIFIVGQNNNNSNNMMMMRILLTGALDTAFNTNGKKEVDGAASGADTAFKVAVEPTMNQYDIVGVITGAGPRMGMAVLLSDGTLDTAFQTNGKFAIAAGTAAYSINLTANRDILMVGKETTAADLMAIRLIRQHNGDISGSFDTAFSNDGINIVNSSTSDAPNFATTDNNNKLIAFFYNAGKSFGLVRWTSAGALDTSFKTTGSFNETPTGIANIYLETGGQALGVSEDNSIVVAYTVSTSGATYPLYVERYTSDGRVDTAFKTSGVFELASEMTTAAFAAKAITITRSNKIFVNSDTGADIRIHRLLTDGNWDTTFGGGGKYLLDTGVKDDPRGAMILDNGWFCGTGTVAATNALVYCLWQ